MKALSFLQQAEPDFFFFSHFKQEESYFLSDSTHQHSIGTLTYQAGSRGEEQSVVLTSSDRPDEECESWMDYIVHEASLYSQRITILAGIKGYAARSSLHTRYNGLC